MLLRFADAIGQQLGQNLPHVQANSTTLDMILNVVYMVAGALAVIFIIIGGIHYITSAGEPGKITKAKNTIIYAIIGLIIVILAFAITNYVIGTLGKIDVNNKSQSAWMVVRDLVINVLLYFGGLVAVFMIMFGGFRYITAGGNAAAITKAKDTILYAVIGLVVAILAYAIVNFVIASV